MTGSAAGPRTTILAIDSATTRVVVAVGTLTGELIDATEWPAGYRHGETLLPTIAALLERLELTPASVAAIVVGTGPGAFTGLRVGIATAKGMAHALGVPIVGVSTADALLAGAARTPCSCSPPDPPIASWPSRDGPLASSRPARTRACPAARPLSHSISRIARRLMLSSVARRRVPALAHRCSRSARLAWPPGRSTTSPASCPNT